MKIIGISGLIGTGKSISGTILNDMINSRGQTSSIINFGDKIKEISCLLFHWDITRLGDDYSYKEGNLLDNGDIDPACKLLNVRSRREVLQKLGTEGIRHGFNPATWVISLQLDIMDIDDDYVIIPDVRFVNELSWIKKQNGILIKVTRDHNNTTLETTHISEHEWGSWTEWDYVIHNVIDPNLNTKQNRSNLADKLRIVL